MKKKNSCLVFSQKKKKKSHPLAPALGRDEITTRSRTNNKRLRSKKNPTFFLERNNDSA